MVTVAAWEIRNKWNKVVAKFRYRERQEADECLTNLAIADPDERFFIQMVKDSIDELAKSISNITCTERVVKGITTDKATGERKFWRKVFVDVVIYATYEGWTSVRKFTKHRLRGNLRVITPAGSMSSEQFETYAKQTWPEGWEEVCLFFEE